MLEPSHVYCTEFYYVGVAGKNSATRNSALQSTLDWETILLFRLKNCISWMEQNTECGEDEGEIALSCLAGIEYVVVFEGRGKCRKGRDNCSLSDLEYRCQGHL